MKSSVISIAAAVGFALVSVAANAGLVAPPVSGGNFQAPAAAPTTTGLFLAIFDTAGTHSDLVNLGYDTTAVNLASGNLNPDTAGGAFSLAANPTGAAGQVLQVDFGIVPGFSTVSGTLATDQFMVVGGISGGAGTEQAVVGAPNTPPTAFSAVSGLINNIQTEIADWQASAPTSGFLTDTTGTQTYSPQSGPLHSGALVTNQSFSAAVGSALSFFNITTTSSHVAHDTAYTNASSPPNGFFFLGSNGDLTYNIGAPAPVPLPAAAWLFTSGLLGLVGVARRRRAQA